MKTFALRFIRIIENIISLCLLSVFGITVILVIMKYFFNTSITGANEIVIILFIYSTAIGASLAIAKGDHISITVFTEKLPKRFTKPLQIIQLFLLITINAVLFWYCFQWIEITGGYKMPMTGLPRSVVQLSIPIGCGIALIFCVNSVISVLRVNGKNELPNHSGPLKNK